MIPTISNHEEQQGPTADSTAGNNNIWTFTTSHSFSLLDLPHLHFLFFFSFLLFPIDRMQNGNERSDLLAGSSSAPTQSATPVAATRTGNPPVLPPLTSLEFGQSKFSLDTAVSAFCCYFADTLVVTRKLRPAGRTPCARSKRGAHLTCQEP